MSNKASKSTRRANRDFDGRQREELEKVPLGQRKLERALGRNCRLRLWAVSGIWLMLILLYVQVSVVHLRVVFTGRLDWRWKSRLGYS